MKSSHLQSLRETAQTGWFGRTWCRLLGSAMFAVILLLQSVVAQPSQAAGPVLSPDAGLPAQPLPMASQVESAERLRASLRRLLQQTHDKGCTSIESTLQDILCKERILVGVRDNYPGFGVRKGGEYVGFEIDLARRIAAMLGVEIVFKTVTPALRIRDLLENKVDLVLATMAHTTGRDQVVHFVRPHYYSSPTAVVGRKGLKFESMDDLGAASVCVPLGSYSNIVFGQNQVRLLIYDTPNKMIDALRFGACNLIAHDQSILRAAVTGPNAPAELRERYDEKFAFNEISWGMAVTKRAGPSLGKALSLIVAELHASGEILAIARAHHVEVPFLLQQDLLWSSLSCLDGDGDPQAGCFLSPAIVSDPPSMLAPAVRIIERWFSQMLDLPLQFPMFSGQQAMNMLAWGSVVSIVLVSFTILSTLVFSFLLYRAMTSTSNLLRIAGLTSVLILQNSPVILLLVLGYLVASSVLVYTGPVALLTAVIAIGLNNGAAGASALREAANTLGPSGSSLSSVVAMTTIQLRACVINAAKASPVAAFIGAPEMLSVLTDITSFTGERVVTFIMLSLFYLLIVQTVVVLSDRIASRYRRRVHVTG